MNKLLIDWDFKKILTLLLAIALIAFTAADKVPIAAFTGVAGTAIGSYYEKKRKEG